MRHSVNGHGRFDKGKGMNARDASRQTITVNQATAESVQVGCLQRIADATEAMARNYVSMQRDLEYYQNRCKYEQSARQRLLAQRAALRGVITKLKKQLQDKETNASATNHI